jgi:hypothetical protein
MGWQVSGQNVSCRAHCTPDRAQVVKALLTPMRLIPWWAATVSPGRHGGSPLAGGYSLTLTQPIHGHEDGAVKSIDSKWFIFNPLRASC